MVPRGMHWPELQLGTKVPTEPAAALKAWPSLRHAQAPVQAFCTQYGIPYSQTGLLGTYAQVLRHLHTTGRTASPEPGC